MQHSFLKKQTKKTLCTVVYVLGKHRTNIFCTYIGTCFVDYLSEDSIFTRGVQSGVVTVLHGKATVDVKAGHEVRLTGLRVLQALGDEGRATLGQQQELLYTLQSSTKFEERVKKERLAWGVQYDNIRL